VVLDDSSAHTVEGTVYELPKDAGVLRKLDYYEEFDPESPHDSLFLRILHPVELVGGRLLQCWIYEYNQRLETASSGHSARLVKPAREV
jgi:gamma-glutamylcyclotransferase (GGCT)/AIG2-like uncharacterized protein YtfP